MMDDLDAAYLGITEISVIPVAEYQHIETLLLKITRFVKLQIVVLPLGETGNYRETGQ